MPISTIGRAEPARPDGGFSLLEILAVLMILAAAGGAAVLALPSPDSAADRTAERLSLALGQAAQRSVVGGVPIGVAIDRDVVRFSEAGRTGWRPAGTLDDQTVPDGVRVEAVAGDGYFSLPEGVPVIRFDPVGLASPAEIRVQDQDGGRRVIIIAADAAVTLIPKGN